MKQFSQALSLGAADRDFRLFLVVQAQLIGALEPGNDFFDVVDIYYEGTMRAPE
jgi:hypothetical protein